MSYFNIVAQTTKNTVITEYEPVTTRSDSYQSEAALEKKFIRLLCEQGYEYLPIHSEVELTSNLRKKLEDMNSYRDGENVDAQHHITIKVGQVRHDLVLDVL